MTESNPATREPLTTGIPGLDTVLCGGFGRGRTYMLMGAPGAGKTIFANQVGFHRARQGERVLYVTLLAESHTDLVANLRSLSFFEPSLVPETVTYLSAFTVLEEGGLESLLELIRKEVRLRGATFLVLDGLLAAEEAAPTPQLLKKFIHTLQVVTGIMGCTTLVLTTGSTPGLRAEHTMVDGLLMLRQRSFGVRTVRELSVRKFRGGPHLLGRHGFEITRDGLCIFPRLETLIQSGVTSAETTAQVRRAFGVPGLDEMMRGGVPSGSTTLLFGPSGGGKTLLGTHFLAQGARQGERGHYFSFYDSPQRMVDQAAGVGMNLGPLMREGALEMSYHPPMENVLDKLGAQLLAIIQGRGVKRLFIDGYDALHKASVRRSPIAPFLAALVNECRAHGVTMLLSAESRAAFGPEVLFPIQGLSMLAENIVYVRSVELNCALRRVLCILKMRNSDYDTSFRELRISGQGMEATARFEDAQRLVTGVALQPSRQKRRGD